MKENRHFFFFSQRETQKFSSFFFVFWFFFLRSFSTFVFQRKLQVFPSFLIHFSCFTLLFFSIVRTVLIGLASTFLYNTRREKRIEHSTQRKDEKKMKISCLFSSPFTPLTVFPFGMIIVKWNPQPYRVEIKKCQENRQVSGKNETREVRNKKEPLEDSVER